MKGGVNIIFINLSTYLMTKVITSGMEYHCSTLFFFLLLVAYLTERRKETMSVFKRGRIWYTDFVVDGVRICKSTKKHTKREAKQFEAAERTKLLTEAPQHKSAKLSLQEAIEQTYDTKWKSNKDGMGSYRRATKLLEHMGNVPMSSIDEFAVYLLVKRLEATGIESSTINRYLAVLKTILKHNMLPTEYIKLRKEAKGRIRVLSKDEELRVVELLRGADSRGKKSYYADAADMVSVLSDTGMRLSELLNLRYEDISFPNNLISIWVNKGDRPRSIPMTTRVRMILELRQETVRVKPFTLSVDEAERAWQWVRAEMGLMKDKEFVMHSLRHTCASRLVNGNVDLYVVKELLGHSSIQITERYAHLNPIKLVRAVEVLE
jgi:integrase